jgi:uroporphyrin-III C-methyltransferase/precorrin-2 dehydrogenase/sirohydrochlorin ferrochelatase
MRYLPVFLDLQSGKVLLVGAGDLARAKLRLLAAAGAQVRWYATDGDHDVAGLAACRRARIERAKGDPLRPDLSCIDRHPLRRRRRDRRCDVGAREGGRACPSM